MCNVSLHQLFVLFNVNFVSNVYRLFGLSKYLQMLLHDVIHCLNSVTIPFIVCFDFVLNL